MTDQALDAIFRALSDPTRRAILARLTEGDASVSELMAPFPVSQPAISRHLKVLERAGLISRSRQSTVRLSHLEAAPLRDATAWLARYRAYWDESFERLDELFANLDGPTTEAAHGNHDDHRRAGPAVHRRRARLRRPS